MSIDSERQLANLQTALSLSIGAVKSCFRTPVRVAIIVRNPSVGDGDVMIGDATAEDVRHVLRLEERTDSIVLNGNGKLNGGE